MSDNCARRRSACWYSCSRISGLGTATQKIPARCAARLPLSESSNTMASSALSPSAPSAARNRSGAGFEFAIHVERVRRASDVCHPAVERQRAAVRRKDLLPRLIVGGFRVDDQAVEVKDQTTNHDLLSPRLLAATAFCAASASVLAVSIFASARMARPSASLVPTSRTTIGTRVFTWSSAETMPLATSSQRVMPPKMLNSTAF